MMLLPLPPGEGRGEGVLGAGLASAGRRAVSTVSAPLRSQDPLVPALSRREREQA